MPSIVRAMLLPVELILLSLTSIAMLSPATAAAQELRAPKDWITRPERFVEMPPGWHLTAGRGVILYNPAAMAEGEFVVESEGFLFDPEGASGSYGLILGGRELDTDAPRYVAFEISTDSRFSVRAVRAYESTDLATGTHPGILPWTGETATVRNVLEFDAGATHVRFLVNGDLVAELPRADIDPDGIIGFRIDAGLNTHITTLDVSGAAGTQHWAPVPPEED
mgnify:CR=1 FL=1